MDADKHAAFMGRLTFGARRKQSWKDIQGVTITAAIHPPKKTKIRVDKTKAYYCVWVMPVAAAALLHLYKKLYE